MAKLLVYTNLIQLLYSSNFEKCYDYIVEYLKKLILIENYINIEV